MAQQQSAIISLSVSLPLAMLWQSTGMASLIRSYLGKGLPRHKLLNAQQPCLMRVYSLVLLTLVTRLASPPALMMVSL